MPSARLRIVFTTAAIAVLVLSGARGRGQAPSPQSGIVVDYSAPPAIDRGLAPDVSRSPDSPETTRRRTLRVEGAPSERMGASGARYLAGRVIVKFKDGVSAAAKAAALAAGAASASTRPSYADFDIISIDASADAEAAARALAARPDVEYAQASYRVRTQFTPNDTFYARQWNLPDIDMERAWDIQPQAGSAITVAVVDTGIAYTNVTMRYRARAFRVSGASYPALGDLTLPFVAATELGDSSRFVKPHDFIWDTDLPLDLDGHGTHVSGTIGQLTNNSTGTAGVAFNVKLMPVKVIDTEWDSIFGAPHEGTDDTVARGVRYAADNGANVINMSIGRDGPPAPVVEDAVKYAVGKGAFVAIAAGNGFEDGNPLQAIADIASRVKGAVAVGAIDRAHNRSYFSSTGAYVELAAPGGSFRGFGAEGGILQQTLDLNLVDTFELPPAAFRAPRFDALAYFYFIGTSQSTAHVSGLAAMLVQQGVTDPAAVEAALERFAIDPATRKPRGKVRDNEFGFGEISARDTLRGLGLAK